MGGMALRLDRRLIGAVTAGLILHATSAGAQEADYWLVQVSKDHTLFEFIDASTITHDGPFRSVWVTEIAAGKENAKRETRRKMTFALFDCGRKLSRESRIVTYDKGGDVLTDRPREGDFRTIDPESLEAVELEFACGNSDRWTAKKAWTEIDTTPEKKADSDNKAFSTPHAR
jgi:hypothetical protein